MSQPPPEGEYRPDDFQEFPHGPGDPGAQPWGQPPQNQPVQPRSHYENPGPYGYYTSRETGGARRGCGIVAIVFVILMVLGILGMVVAFMFVSVPM